MSNFKVWILQVIKNAVIVAVGAGLTYAVQVVSGYNFGNYSEMAAALGILLIKAIHKATEVAGADFSAGAGGTQ